MSNQHEATDGAHLRVALIRSGVLTPAAERAEPLLDTVWRPEPTLRLLGTEDAGVLRRRMIAAGSTA